MTTETLGRKLLKLKERSALSLENIAKASGYSRASSIQRYFSDDFDAPYLPGKLVDRLSEALVGFGDPPIVKADIEELAEFGFLMRRKINPSLPDYMFRRAPRKTIECNTSVVGNLNVDKAQVFTIYDDPIAVFKRPDHLLMRDLSAIYIDSTSMSPRYRPGDMVIYEGERPARIGQDVIAIWFDQGDKVSRGFIATLVRRDSENAEFEIFDPPARFVVAMGSLDSIAPILPLNELLTPDFTHLA